MYNLVTHSVMQCHEPMLSRAQCIQCTAYMKQDGCFQWCTMYSAQISRLARPCCVPAPSRIQTPDNCPPQLLPHAPLPPNHDPRMETFFWTNWHLQDFSHLPCKACAIWIFCPLSHWHPRQVKTCQPGQLRWNTNFQRWVFWRLIAKMLWNFSRVKLHYQKIMSEHKGLFGECWNLEELFIIDLASMYAWFLYSQYIPSVLLIEIQLNDREPLSSQD